MNFNNSHLYRGTPDSTADCGSALEGEKHGQAETQVKHQPPFQHPPIKVQALTSPGPDRKQLG